MYDSPMYSCSAFHGRLGNRSGIAMSARLRDWGVVEYGYTDTGVEPDSNTLSRWKQRNTYRR
jgi:hypothetical protein